MSHQIDYYRVLNVRKDASAEEILSSYRRASLLSSPHATDHIPSEQFRLVQQAFEVLGDKRRRLMYDSLYSHDNSQHEVVPAFFSGNVPAPRYQAFSNLVTWINKSSVAKLSPKSVSSSLAWLTSLPMASAVAIASVVLNENWLGLSGWLLTIVLSIWVLLHLPNGKRSKNSLYAFAGSMVVLLCVYGVLVGVATVVWMFIFAISAGLTAYLWRVKNILTGRVEGYGLTANTILEQVELGTPVGSIERAKDLGRIPSRGIERTLHVHRLSAEVLSWLTNVPSVRIVHGVQLGAFVGHVIVCGDRVALVEAILCPPGDYEMNARGDVMSDKGETYSVHSNLGTAISFASAPLRGARVRGWVALFQDHEGEFEVSTSKNAPSSLRLVNAQSLLNEVGTFLAEGKRNDAINVELINEIWKYKVAE